jgi:hypothetical protein
LVIEILKISSHREQKLLLKQNQQNIIDFLLNNKDSIRIEDLKICEPIYKCYREKGNCHICNRLFNIICIGYNHNSNLKESLVIFKSLGTTHNRKT